MKRSPAKPTIPRDQQPIYDVGERWRFEILGPPATKKNHQRIVTRPDGTPFIVGAKSARDWEATAIDQLALTWARLTSIVQPVEVTAIFYRQRAAGDLLNYLAALSDALEHSGILLNDVQVVSVDGSRLDKDAHNPRVDAYVTIL